VTIYGFYAEINGKKVYEVCKEKQAALETYDDTIAGGHGAYLLEKVGEHSYKLNVGNLPPQAECIMSFKYASVLTTDGDAFKLRVPITQVSLNGATAGTETERFPDGLSLRASTEMSSRVVSLESETHTIKPEINGTSATFLGGLAPAQPAREFIFLIRPADPHSVASSFVEVYTPPSPAHANTNIRSTAVMPSLYPRQQPSSEWSCSNHPLQRHKLELQSYFKEY